MPNDPNMPGGPQGPGGGGQPPGNFDPNLSNALDRMNQTLDSIDDKMKRMAEHSGAVAEDIDDATKKMHEFYRVSTNVEDAHKSIVEFAKKRGKIAKGDLEDVNKAKRELQALEKLYGDALKNQKASSKETRAWESNLKQIHSLLKQLPQEGKLATAEFQKMADIFQEAGKDAKAIAKAMGEMSRTTATMKGMSGIAASLGIGKGFNARVEKRMQQAEEVRKAAIESREIREIATKKHMGFKRDKTIEALTGKGIDPKSDTGLGKLAEGMGFKPGSDKYLKFIAGEKAGGALGGSAATGAEGAGWQEAMTSGGGAIEGLSTAIEGGIMDLTALAPEIMIPLEILTAAIYALIEIFDTYAKQNQEIEKNVGQGGLFTQPGVSAGTAFAQAREALNPNASARGLALGITQERNMKLAGAMAESGYNVADSFKPGASNAANEGPGAGGAFMKGSLGEFQRIVMGVSRVAGLDDAQSTANLIKLLQQYRETMASSEDFMTQLNKDTQAAGISTTKYLKIIDDVSSHFDKMSKSLEEVTGVMRELSRYGAVSSESLKDMMDFLTQGQDKTSMGNIGQSIYTQMVMPKALQESMKGGESSVVSSAVDALNKELERGGMAKLNISGMSQADARAAISQKRQEAMSIPDRTTRQNVYDAMDKLQDQMLHASTVGGGAFKRGGGGSLYGEDMIQQTGKLFSNLDEITSKAGASIQDLMQGTLSGVQEIQIQQEAEMLGIHDPKNAIKLLRDEAANRIQEATSEETPIESRKKFIKQMLMDIGRKPGGLKVGLAGTQFEGLSGDLDSVADAMAHNTKDARSALAKNADTVGGSVDTQARILDKMRMEQKTGVLAQRDALDQAADIGKRTQTVEDILKNIFKPLFTDLLTAVEFIAEGVGKFLGKDFDVNQKQVHADMAAIPTAMADLQKKTDELMDSQEKLAKKAELNGGKLSDPDQKQFDAQKKAIDENTKTMSYLGDVQTKGAVGSGQEEDVLEKTLSGLHKYIKDGGSGVAAPTMKDMTPGFWSNAWHDAIAASPITALAANAISGVASSGNTTNYYSADASMNLNKQPDGPADANEGSPGTPTTSTGHYAHK
jgi:hypothetical protein